MSEDRTAIAGSLRRVSVVEIDDSGTQQRVRATGLAGEEFRNVVRAQPFGFSSVPPSGAEGLLLAQGGRADRAHMLGLEHPDHRPRSVEVGGSVIYDASGQVISIFKNNIRIVGGGTVMISAPDIILAGKVRLGGADADKPASMLGTVDSAGHTEQSNLATMVFVK